MEIETTGGLVGLVHADCPFDDWQDMQAVPWNDISMTGRVADCCLWSMERFSRDAGGFFGQRRPRRRPRPHDGALPEGVGQRPFHRHRRLAAEWTFVVPESRNTAGDERAHPSEAELAQSVALLCRPWEAMLQPRSRFEKRERVALTPFGISLQTSNGEPTRIPLSQDCKSAAGSTETKEFGSPFGCPPASHARYGFEGATRLL